jgi:hypothetical protein
LDTTPTLGLTEVAAIEAVVNGPEDALLDWDAVGWRQRNCQYLWMKIFRRLRVGGAHRVVRRACR